jgi:hypothetical protein
MSQCSGDVDSAGEAVQADHEIPQGGHDCGPEPVLTWDRSSAKVTSRTHCRAFSICHWPRIKAASSSGWAWCGARLVIA